MLTPDGSRPDPPSTIEPWITLSQPRDSNASTDHIDAYAIEGVASLDDLLSAIRANPLASLSLALLLRGSNGRGLADGLIAESTTYSMLLASPEFVAWRAAHPIRPRPPIDRPAVTCHRHRDVLIIGLNHGDTRNALSTTMRDALISSLELAIGGDGDFGVRVGGVGATFCSGGDLNDFATYPDPASAHRIRLASSIGAMVDRLGDRICFWVHGDCRGSGVEIPAFAPSVVAHPETTFALPEVGMGLIPGAGGTVSITRRIGRLRAATLILSGAIIDATRAWEWGLIDGIDEKVHPGP